MTERASTVGKAVATCEAPLPEGVPEWVKLLPAGKFSADDGRAWNLGAPEDVVRLSTASGIDLPVDYHHHSITAQTAGHKAVAAGWIKALAARPDGIHARIEWTPAAAEHLRDREYRFISPTFFHDAGGEVLKIISAALTNVPALPQLPALAERKDMDPLEQIRAVLGLDGAADPAAVVQATEALAEKAEKATDLHKAVCEAAGVDPGNGDVVATVKALAAKPDTEAAGNGGETVALAEHQALQAANDGLNKRLAALEAGYAMEKASTEVEKAVADGKLAPAQKDWAVGYAARDPEGFKAFCSAQPVIVQPGTQLATGTPAPGGDGLSAEDLAVCEAVGLDRAAFAATRKEETDQ